MRERWTSRGGGSCRAGRVAALVTLIAVALPASSLANGRFPAANQLVFDPTDDRRLVLRTTFGIVQSFDAGKSWTWVCEQAAGYAGVFDPAIAVTSDGRLLAGVFDGVTRGDERGCTWSRSGTPLEGEYVIDLAVDPVRPARAVALTSTGLGGGVFRVIVAETTDGAKTWTALGSPLPTDFNSETIELSRSDPDRIYVSGSFGTPAKGVVHRSIDHGKTWTRHEVPASSILYVAAVDPTDADRVYTRSRSVTGDRLLVSTDGAATFRDLYTAKGALLGFALSPGGTTVALGGPEDGVLTAPRGDTVFTKVHDAAVRCLAWREDGLHACAVDGIASLGAPTGFTLGRSSDEGRSFVPLFHLKQLEMLVCDAKATAAVCATYWPETQDSLGLPRDAGPDAIEDASPRPSEPGVVAGGRGCGCSVPGGRSPELPIGVLAIVLALRRASRCSIRWPAPRSGSNR